MRGRAAAGKASGSLPPGATRTDAEDGSLIGRIDVNASAIDTSQSGRYTVYYTCADSADNFVAEGLYVNVNP